MKTRVYGTLGPQCCTQERIAHMFEMGMCGMRLNLSHVSLQDSQDWLNVFRAAAQKAGVQAELLIDMKGPELRIGVIDPALTLQPEDVVVLGKDIPVEEKVREQLLISDQILLDDGKILLDVIGVDEHLITCKVVRPGVLTSKKSLAVVGRSLDMPVLTESDVQNLKHAKEFGVTGIMQPFVRTKEDLMALRKELEMLDCGDLRVFAKIENEEGFRNLESLLPYCDEIIVARGDLANSVGLVNVICIQYQIEDICKRCGKEYMIVTQMLDSMISKPVPTRAEVSDVYGAVYRGCHSIMLTGETAGGKYPEEAMQYFTDVAKVAESGQML